MGRKVKKLKKIVQDHGVDAVGVVAAAVGAGMGFDKVATNYAHIPGMGTDLVSAYKDLFGGGTTPVPNPYFYLNGFDEEDSPATRTYLRHRKLKSYGGAAFSLIGAAVSPAAAGVNAAGIARHGSSVMSTGFHLYHIHSIARSYRQSATISQWVDLIIKMKAIKAASQGTQLTASCMPGGTYAAAGVAAACLGSSATLIQKIAGKTLGGACSMAAMEIHWRAYREQSVLGAQRGVGAGTGPATRIIAEVFNRRQYRVLGGQYNYHALIREPAGWQALNDKLMLL